MPTETLERAPSYDEDFTAWARDQAARLRALKGTAAGATLDLDNLIEEVEDLGAADRRAVESYAELIIQHLLLIEHSPAVEHRAHWSDEVDGFRSAMGKRLAASLKRGLAADLDGLYREGRRLARRKLERHGEHQVVKTLPLTCPYTLDQITDDWWPGEEGG